MAAHQHPPADARDERRVLLAMLLIGSFMAVEVVGGILAGSLALLADAAHMVTDAAALGLAWLSFRISRRPPDDSRTYGYGRLQILAAFVNALVLLAVVAWIAYEAIRRLFEPVPVLGGLMLAIAGVGLVINIAAFAILHEGRSRNLNLRGAAVHVLGDLLGSLGAIVAALVIIVTGWTPIDPLLSLVVGGIVLRSAWSLLLESGHVLLEGAPADLDPGMLKADLVALEPEIEDVHHVHAWSLTTEQPLVTLHVTIRSDADADMLLARIKRRLQERWQVDHSVVQLECACCPDLRAGGSRGWRLG